MTDFVDQVATARGFRFPQVNGAGSKRIVSGLVLAAAMLLFMLAKNIATSGAVTAERFDYWLVGLLPFAVHYGLNRMTPDIGGSSKRLTVGLTTWLAVLLSYLLFQLTFISEVFEFPIQAGLGYGSIASKFAISCIYSAAGSASVFVLQSLRARGKEVAIGLSDFTAAFLANWLLLFALLFLI